MSLRTTVMSPQVACEKLLDVVGGLVPPTHEPVKTPEEQGKAKNKPRKGQKHVAGTTDDSHFLAATLTYDPHPRP